VFEPHQTTAANITIGAVTYLLLLHTSSISLCTIHNITHGTLTAPRPPGPCPTSLGELSNAYLLHTATLAATHHRASLQYYGLEY